jgi:hypothetical protein
MEKRQTHDYGSIIKIYVIMVLLLRVFLIGLVVYLLVRSFFVYGREENNTEKNRKNSKSGKQISKDTGDFIDYEEVK